MRYASAYQIESAHLIRDNVMFMCHTASILLDVQWSVSEILKIAVELDFTCC